MQFDQSQLMLASAEYYQLGLSHPIMQTYYNILVNVATMMGADIQIAKKDMKDLLEFEIELARVCVWVTIPFLINIQSFQKLNYSSSVLYIHFCPQCFSDIFFQIMIPPEDRRNYSAIYNKITLNELQTMVRWISDIFSLIISINIVLH